MSFMDNRRKINDLRSASNIVVGIARRNRKRLLYGLSHRLLKMADELRDQPKSSKERDEWISHAARQAKIHQSTYTAIATLRTKLEAALRKWKAVFEVAPVEFKDCLGVCIDDLSTALQSSTPPADKWISVKERLPDNTRKVQVKNGNGEISQRRPVKYNGELLWNASGNISPPKRR